MSDSGGKKAPARMSAGNARMPASRRRPPAAVFRLPRLAWRADPDDEKRGYVS